MNNRNLILEIVRHPLIRKILEAKMATTSEVARLVVTEMQGKINLLEFRFRQNKELTQVGNMQQLKKWLDTLQRKTANIPIKTFTIQMADKDRAVEMFRSNYNNVINTENYLELSKKPTDVFKDVPEDHGPKKNGYPTVYDYILHKFVPMAQKALKPQEAEMHDCLKLLGELIEIITKQNNIDKETLFQISQLLIKVITGDKEVDDQVVEIYEFIVPTLEKLDDKINKLKEAISKDPECKKQFGDLKQKDPESYIIGKFIINYKYLLEKLKKTEPEEDCVTLLKKLILIAEKENEFNEEQFQKFAVKMVEVFVMGGKFENDEEKKNILATFEKIVKPFIEKNSAEIDKFIKMYEDDIEKCKEKVEALKDDDIPKYKIAIFLLKYREILEKMGQEPPDEEPPAGDDEEEELDEEDIQLEKDAIKTYEKAYKMFLSQFMKVKTLHKQSEIFRVFYDSIYPIAGIPTDKIVGEQLAAYTQTARPDLQVTDKDIQNELQEGKDAEKLSKDIAAGANVVERHSQAILEILEGYEKYLNVGAGNKGGVEQGSRILFDKFGESQPKKLLYKFVKLIVKDINESFADCEDMIAQIDSASGGEQQNESLLKEDLSVRKLGFREKIILVAKTHNKIKTLGQNLLDMISRGMTGDEEAADKKAKEDAAAQAAQDDNKDKPKNESLLREEPDDQQFRTQATDQMINPDPTGTKSGATDRETRTARQGDEIQSGYRVLAKQIFDLLTKIRPLFPTSQPFDTDYGFSAAMKAFKQALKGLRSHVAKIQGFKYDQLTNKATLRSYMTKIVGFKKVIKEIFGFTDDEKNAKRQAAFSEAGENSGLPEKTDYEQAESEPAAKNNEELKKKIDDLLKRYENTFKVLFSLITTRREVVDDYLRDKNRNNVVVKQFLDSHFESFAESSNGVITKLSKEFTRFNVGNASTIKRIKDKKSEEIKTAIDNGELAKVEELFKNFRDTMMQFINTETRSGGASIEPDGPAKKQPEDDFDPNTNLQEKKATQAYGVDRVKPMVIGVLKFVVEYIILESISAAMSEAAKIDDFEIDIKSTEKIIKEMLKNILVTHKQLRNTYNNMKNSTERRLDFYEMFLRLRMGKTSMPADDEVEQSGGGKKRKPSPPPQGDFQASDERSTAQRQKRAQRQRERNLEEAIVKRLKPLVQEILRRNR